MPTPITFGAISARSFGFGLSRGAADGTFGVVADGLTTSATSKYVFASDTSVAGGNWSVSPNMAVIAAVGNATVGIYLAIKYVGQGATQKYTWASNTATAGSALYFYVWSSTGSTACGINTLAIFLTGSGYSSTYTYAGDVTANSSVGGGSSVGSVTGNATTALFAIAGTTGTMTYTYSGATWGTGPTLTNMSNGEFKFGQAGNAVTGLTMGSYSAAGCCCPCPTYGFQWNLNNWASGTVTHSTSSATLGVGGYLGSIIGNSKVAVMDMSTANPAYKYTFASNLITTGGSFHGTPNQYNGGASNGISGVTV